MRRRAVLAGIGAATTGCLERPIVNDPDPRSEQQSADGATSNDRSARPPESKRHRPSTEELKVDCHGSVSSTKSNPGEVRTPEIRIGVDEPENDVTLDVEVVRGFTSDHPAKIEVVFGNDADEKRTFHYGPRPLSHGRHVERDAALMAGWRGTDTFTLDADGCWRSDTELIAEPILMEESLPPGATNTETYVLTVPRDADECMPRGVYRFSATIEVGRSGDTSAATDLEWALCLH